MSSAVPEEMPPPGGTAIATIHSRLQTLAKTLSENLLADLNAHPRRNNR
jgi:hypothetical protein